MRTKADNIKALVTKNNKTIELIDGQHFAHTPKTYEIWGGKPLIQRIAVIRKSSVLWVIEK